MNIDSYYRYDLMSKVLKHLRMKSKYTQTDAAYEMDIGASTISSHENGKSTPDLYTIAKYCSLYGLELYEFFHLVAFSVDNTTPITANLDISKEAAVFSLT